MFANKRDQTLRTGNRNHLPLPTGSYQNIGFYDIMTGTDKNDGVFARILYPAVDQNTKITEKFKEWPNWFPQYNYRDGFLNVANIYWGPALKLLNYFSPEVYIPILQNVEPFKMNNQKFPVIIFSHGLASCRTTYSSVCYEMASYGFIVIVLEHRDQSASSSFYPNNGDSSEPFKWVSYRHSYEIENDLKVRNEQLDERVLDVNEVLLVLKRLQKGDEFKNLLEPKMESEKFVGMFDLDNIILMGHSFGSSTAIRSLLTVESIKLAVCLDAWMYPLKDLNENQITKPIIFINMQKFQNKPNLSKMRKFITNDGKNTRTRKVFTVKDSRHTDQSDIPFVISSFVRWIFKMRSKVNPFVVHDLSTALAIDFIIDILEIKLIKDKKEFIDEYQDQIFEGIANLD